MTEEEIQALRDAKEAAEAAAEAAKAEAEKAKNDLTGVVDELKEVRSKKQEAEEKLKSFNNPNPEPAPQGDTGTPDVTSLVEQALAKKEQERAQREMQEAVEEFKNSKTEFQVDTSGIVFDKFKKELSRFNFSDVKSKEEAKQRLEEAYDFIRRKQQSSGEPNYEGTNNPPSTPKSEDGSIDSNTKRVLESNKIDPERFNKLSSKYGDALAGLGFGR